MNFQQKLNKIIIKNNSLLCIGLDPDLSKIPEHLKKEADPIFTFNKAIIDNTSDLVCAYKPNIAYYEAEGIEGMKSLKQTLKYATQKYPAIPFICDAKRGDISSTSKQYAKALFDYYGFDAATVNPYLGLDAVESFLDYKDKGIIILCRTSNPSASDFQDFIIKNEPLYVHIAKKIVEWDKKYQNCLMVVGATWPEELGKIRNIASDMFFLVPGIGTQGGDLEKTLRMGLNKNKSGLIINVGRAIIYAGKNKDFAQKAREKTIELKTNINMYRK